MQKEFLKSCEGFLRAALTVPGHPGPVWKIAKMALFDLCMEFENFLGQMTSFEVLWKCHFLTLSKKCLRLRPAPSKCLSERISWIISRIHYKISKILFVLGSYEFLAMLEGKIRKCLFFHVKIFKKNSVAPYKDSSILWCMARSFYGGVFPHKWKKYHSPNGEIMKFKCYGKILQ